MTTFSTILLLIVYGAIISFAGIFVLNIAGLPGAFLAGKPDKRSKTQLLIGVFVSAIGQSFVYLAYISFIVSWTNFKIDNVDTITIKFLIWIFAFLASFLPILKMRTIARVEDNETGAYHRNPQVEGLDVTLLIALIAFFIFVFLPQTMTFLWSWVPYVGK